MNIKIETTTNNVIKIVWTILDALSFWFRLIASDINFTTPPDKPSSPILETEVTPISKDHIPIFSGPNVPYKYLYNRKNTNPLTITWNIVR